MTHRTNLSLWPDDSKPKDSENSVANEIKEAENSNTAATSAEEKKESSSNSPTKPVTSTLPGQREKKDKPVSANAFASGANMNGAQVMTGRPTSRVLHPGGGGGPTSWKLG